MRAAVPFEHSARLQHSWPPFLGMLVADGIQAETFYRFLRRVIARELALREMDEAWLEELVEETTLRVLGRLHVVLEAHDQPIRWHRSYFRLTASNVVRRRFLGPLPT